MKKMIATTILILLLTSTAYGATYWISPDGDFSKTLGQCSGSTPLSGTNACTYDKANGSGVQAGDTVYYRGGAYKGITGDALDPYNTGKDGSPITFSSYNGEDVEFYGSGTSSMAVNLNSDYGTVRSYIKVNGLHFNNFMKHLWILKGTHNEISHCSFIGMPSGVTDAQIQAVWSASYIYRQAQYNWIHDCTFGTWGASSTYGHDYGVVFQMGLETSTTDHTEYNLVENCDMYQGGHHVASLNGSYNIYRNNYFHNEPWMPIGSPTFSTRTLFQTGAPGDGMYNLVEENRIGYGGPKNKNEIGGNGCSLTGAYNIWRENTFVRIYTDALWVTKYSGQTDVKYNHVYNNTFWHGGYGRYQYYPSGKAPSTYWDDSYTHPIDIAEGDGTGVYGNVFKNNLFYQNSDLRGTKYSIINHSTHVLPTHQNISSNWFDNAGNPEFVDISEAPDPSNGSQWNFDLQSGSPAIDAGTYLTQAVGSGSGSTSLVVKDAGYFFDGRGMASQIHGATIDADWIAIGTITNVVQISSIDYATNTITLASPMTWGNGADIWLYKNSDGTRVLYGNDPDMGAHESTSTQASTSIPPVPGQLRLE